MIFRLLPSESSLRNASDGWYRIAMGETQRRGNSAWHCASSQAYIILETYILHQDLKIKNYREAKNENKTMSDKLDGLLAWARENGAQLREDCLEYNYDEKKGYHVLIKDIDALWEFKDAGVITVPRKLFITRQLAQQYFKINDQKLSTKYNNNPNGLTEFFLSYITFTKENEYEFFRPYINILPKLNSMRIHPFFWTKEELQLIKGSDLFLTIKFKLLALYDEYRNYMKLYEFGNGDLSIINGDIQQSDDELFAIIEHLQHILKKSSDAIEWTSFVAYVWSNLIFFSRAFPSLITGEDKKELNLAFLLPIVDLLNHNNTTKVSWNYSDDTFNYTNKDLAYLKNGDELFNNYGEKSNVDYLISYGFLNSQENIHNSVNLTLRLDPTFISQAKEHVENLEIVSNDTVLFKISKNDPLPVSLVHFFGYITKLKSEEHITLRSILEGSDQLINILKQKLEYSKEKAKISSNSVHSSVGKIIKQYFNEEKKLFQFSLDSLLKKQKDIISAAKDNIVSFKSIFKSDKVFANSLLLSYGVTKYEDILAKDMANEALLLWVVRASNKDAYKDGLRTVNIPPFVLETFEEISRTISIAKDDVTEFLSIYKRLFPSLGDKIPEVYKVGEWGIKQFIIADALIDRLVWVRDSNSEPLFIQKLTFQ